MKPQFTIRDWLWFVPMALLFIHAIGNRLDIDRLRDRWADVDRRAWGAIGNDRGLDIRLDQATFEIDKLKIRIDSLEQGMEFNDERIDSLSFNEIMPNLPGFTPHSEVMGR